MERRRCGVALVGNRLLVTVPSAITGRRFHLATEQRCWVLFNWKNMSTDVTLFQKQNRKKYQSTETAYQQLVSAKFELWKIVAFRDYMNAGLAASNWVLAGVLGRIYTRLQKYSLAAVLVVASYNLSFVRGLFLCTFYLYIAEYRERMKSMTIQIVCVVFLKRD